MPSGGGLWCGLGGRHGGCNGCGGRDGGRTGGGGAWGRGGVGGGGDGLTRMDDGALVSAVVVLTLALACAKPASLRAPPIA